MIYSIERREAVDAGPAYMVEPIEEMTAVDDQTLELNLDRPFNPFLDWLASPYGLKMVNQDVIEENEKGNDWGQEYLADHCAGTGPYDMTSANPGRQLRVLRRTRTIGARSPTSPRSSCRSSPASPRKYCNCVRATWT